MGHEWSIANKIGLAMTIVIGAVNMVSFLQPVPAGEVGPPRGVLIADSILGVIIVAAAAYAWVKVSRRAATIASVATILAALSALPAFVVDGVPTSVQLIVAAVVLWTVVAVALTLSKSKGSAPVE